MMNKKMKKQVSIALTGLMCGGSFVTNIDAHAQINAENQNEVSVSNLNGRTAKKIGVITATSLNIRKGSSTSHAIIGYLKKGDSVEIVSSDSSGWCKIKYGSGYGYISEQYISITSSSNSNNNTSSATTVTHTGKVNATSLNVRSGAGSNYDKLGSLSKGTNVNIVDKMSNGWYKIKFRNGYAYVSGDYITNVNPIGVSNGSDSSNSNNNTSSSTTVTHTGKVKATTLNVRNGASSSHSKIGSISNGATVSIVDKMSNGWYKIKYGNGYGYVSGDYITDVKLAGGSNSSNDESSSTTVTHTGKVNTAALNVRSGTGTSYSHIGTILKGTTVNIVDKMSNGWYKIKFGNGYGYVSGYYISDVASSSGSSDSSNSSVIKTGTVNTNSLNVRSGDSTSHSKIGSLLIGSKVEIVEVGSNGWYKIKFKGGYGYVSSSYINIEGERNNLNNFLFIGDSFTVGIKNIIESKNSNAYIEAKSGSRPSYWLDKVDSMPSSSKIDGVCLLIGVNGASTPANKSDVKTLINKLSAKYPDKTIYVQKVFPIGRAYTGANPDSFNKSIASLNSVIESHCLTKSNVKFIDTTTGFVDSNGYLIHHNGDGLHISGSYSNTFYNNILSAIKRAG